MDPNIVSEKARWRQCNEDDCLWADCGDGFVVYHRPSGKTHLLNNASVTLLLEVLADPKSLAGIAAAFDPEHDYADSDAYVDRMAELVHRLEQFGLIERV